MALGVPLGSAFGSIAMDTSALVAAARTASSSFGQIGRGAEAARVTIVRTQQQAAAAMDRVRGSLNIQQRAYQILEQEVVAVGQQFGATSIQAQKKQLALDKLSQSVANNQQRMAALDAELREANARLASVGSGAGQAVSRFEQLRGQLERTRATMERVGESMMKTGGILSAGISAPLALLGGHALRVAGDYQQTMSVFQATTQASAAEMERASAMAKALGADLQLPGASAADAASVMLELAKAGLSNQDVMEQARGTMALAATEMMDNAEAAQIAAAAYNTFKAEGLDVAQIADMLAAGSSASSASVASLSQGLEQAGSAFAAAHVPMADLVTQMSLMANAGIRGSDAGTSLKTMLQRLQGPTGDARAAMQTLGISIYDSQGAMLPMRDLVGQFSTSLAGLTQEQRDQAMITIFGADAVRGANIVLAGGVAQYDAMTEAVGRQGAAAELAAARMTGIKGAIDGFMSTVETALLESIEPFLGGIAGLVNAASGAVSAFMGLDAGLRNSIVVFAAVAAAAGPVLLAVGGLMTAAAAVSVPLVLAAGAVAGLAAGLASANPVVIGATVAIAAYMAAQQWGAVVASVSAIAAQTAALAANAVAAAAAAGPFLVLGAVVAGGIAIYQKWSHIADEAAQKWLDQNPAYLEATAALDRYNEASTETQATVAGQATELRKLQDAQAKDIALRAEAAKQGDRDQAWWDTNTAAINERTARMQALTGEITTLMDAEAAAAAMTEEQVVAQQASARATAEAAAATKFAAGDIGGALAELRASANLTEEQMDALGKAITDAAKEGAQAFGAAVGTEVGFLSDREAAQQGHGEKLTKITDSYNADLADLNTRYAQATTDAERAKLAGQIADLKQNHTDRLAEEDTAFQASELKAAEAYAREQAAQLAHLGQMLIDYTTAQATMAGMSDAQIQEMTSKLADQYGVQASLVDRSFSEMTGSIDTWVASGGQNTDAYLANMQRIQAETVTTQQQVDAKIGEMTAQAKADFDAGKLTVEQYAAKLTTIPAAAQRVVDALNGIPTSINSTVTITTVEKTVREGTGGRGDATTRTATTGSPGASGTRALGGPVRPRSLYEVTEGGIPELLAMAGRTYLLTGGQGGQVIPAMRAAQASLAGQGAAMRQKSKDAEDVAGDAYNRLYADPRFRDTIAKAGSEGLIAFRRMWERGDFVGGDFGVQEDDPLIDAIFDARRAAAQGSAPSAQASLTTAMRALAGQGAAMRQAAAVAPMGGGGAMRPAAGAVINLTVAPVFQGAIIDTAERVQAVAQEIVTIARTVIGGDLRAAVDQLIQSGGYA